MRVRLDITDFEVDFARRHASSLLEDSSVVVCRRFSVGFRSRKNPQTQFLPLRSSRIFTWVTTYTSKPDTER